jgi:histidyl-tRNA synthetase
MAQGALPGFRDFYPEALAERSYVMQTWRDVVRRYAFVEYDGPPLEPLDLYTKKSGEEIVGQLYNFVDKGDREVALRPEMTPTFARMVGARANALRRPIRWFSIPQLFRYERQQKGRLREHYQLNVDLVGEADVTADAELLACAIDIMRAFGLTANDVVARVSDRRILQGYLRGLGISEDAFPTVFAVIDKIERQPKEVSREKLRAAISDEQADAILEIQSTTLEQVRARITDPADLVHVDNFTRYLRYISALVPSGAEWVRFDLSIVRGLAYYTGIVFELFDRTGEFRAICGGGRYDNLLSALGGVDLPALGFGMGDVVLTELLRARGLLRSASEQLDYWIVDEGTANAGEGVSALELAMRAASKLRNEGYSVEYPLHAQSASKQRKAAKTRQARHIVLPKVGADSNDIQLIDLDASTPNNG